MSALPSVRIRARRIADADLDSVADLLLRGFSPRRTRAFWRSALESLKGRSVPESAPQFGYLLEADGVTVGAILLIFSTAAGARSIRCNVSSWYVEPGFRSYAPLLVSQALKHKNATFMNISSMPHTRPIIEAQGFMRYSEGLFIAFPLLHAFGGESAEVTDARRRPDAGSNAAERDLLLEHAQNGCISLWCITGDGAHPFVFRPRLVRGVVPSAQLVYCPAVEEFVRFAGPIGAFLAKRGRLPVIIDANGPIGGLRGIYLADTMPKYFKGPDRPRLGDLAYTETALFGI